MSLLEVDALSIEFPTRSGRVRALDRVSLDLQAGELLAVVGESGSGKSVLSYAISGVLDGNAEVVAGRMFWKGAPLAMRREEREARASIAQVFQSPRASLNPIRAVGRTLGDVMRCDARDPRVPASLEAVRIDPDKARSYPFELSGGQCQRVGIALSLSLEPELLVADEPTTGLDVTTEAAVMQLLVQLARQRHAAVLFITHNLALAANYCDRIAVMHAGQLVECGPRSEILKRPLHPYTALLIAATPQHCATAAELRSIPGTIPDLSGVLPPCRFADRCAHRTAACDAAPPPLAELAPRHAVACVHPGEAAC